MTFDLRALVREVCAASASADPAVVTGEVRQRITLADRDTALDQALLTFVRHVISRWGELGTGDHPLLDPHHQHAPGAQPSRKVAAIRGAWRAVLRKRLSVGEDPSAWKFFGDCTDGDLLYAADVRDALAASNARQAQRLRDLAKLLVDHQVVTVKDLPEDVLESVLGAPHDPN